MKCIDSSYGADSLKIGRSGVRPEPNMEESRKYSSVERVKSTHRGVLTQSEQLDFFKLFPEIVI